MHKLLFVGPTLPVHELLKRKIDSPIMKLSSCEQIDKHKHESPNTLFVLPPVSGGDLYTLRKYNSPFIVAIVDGYFENRVSVWHKEILYLLSQGIPVFGSSSMGALRAAELSVFGMTGIGKIYNDFACGVLEDDDEVTVAHGPGELGYPQISEAMVNIRYNFKNALDHGVLGQNEYDSLLEVAKETFYKKRNYGYIIRETIERYGFKETNFSGLHLWLQEHRIDQKKNDALELIANINCYNPIKHSTPLSKFEFQDTFIWNHSIKN